VSAPVWSLSAAEIGRAYRSGALDPIAVLDALVERTARIDVKLNALVTRDATARHQAEASWKRFVAQAPLGPLDGIPIAIKDNLLVRGVRATWGTRGLADYVPDHDELPVAKLRAAGAVIVGKTNVPEFTLEGYTANPVFGVSRNPWDARLTPGGSSGGSVAGCAAGLFPLALCTDGGGSIRRPASHTGLVGFKPSIGAVARADGLPQLLLDFEVVGPVARTVDDAAALFEVLRGPDANDRASLCVPRVGPPARRLTILAVRKLADAPVDPEVAASFDDAVRTLGALGHWMHNGSLPIDLDAVNTFWPLVGQVGLARAFEAWPGLRDAASPKYIEMAAQGERIGAARLLAGLETVAAFRRATAALLETFDVVLMPSAAALPWPAEEAFPPAIDGVSVGPRGHAVFTGWVNVCGHPAISVPSSPSRAGLPIGVQMIGPFGADDLLLALARDYERAAPWALRVPAL